MHNSSTGHTPVTVLGLGLMGQALAGALLDDGHPTTVWNRSAGKATDLVARGATLAASAGDAAEASQLVVVCVSDYAAVRGILDPLAERLSGRVLVNLTSGTSQQARETAEWTARRGVGYLDGAIMAIPPVIGTADAVLLYGGPQSVYDEHRSALASLGGGTTYLGADHGLASLYDVALLGVMWGALNGFVHGAAMLRTADVDAATFAPFANRWVAAVTGFISAYADQIDRGAYPALDATIDVHVAAMEHLVSESESLGVNAELPRLIKALTDRAVADGHGGDSYAAMIELFRAPSAART